MDTCWYNQRVQSMTTCSLNLRKIYEVGSLFNKPRPLKTTQKRIAFKVDHFYLLYYLKKVSLICFGHINPSSSCLSVIQTVLSTLYEVSMHWHRETTAHGRLMTVLIPP